jgi:septum formation protein
MQLVLASSSPRRREILALLEIPFEVIAPQFDEVVSADASIVDEVLAFGRGKAEAVRHKYPDGATIIGSDTMIALDDLKVGKPAGIDEARRMLAALAGRRHTIYTSVVILDPAGEPALQAVETVEVEMRGLSVEEIDAYLAAGESLDKAGAYSIQGQGGKLIHSLRGDYLAAVGLPLRPIAGYLARIGVRHANIDAIYAGKNLHNWRIF